MVPTEAHILGRTSLARVHLALVVRNRQLILETSRGTGRFPHPVLRIGGQIHRRRSFGLDLRRAALCSGTFCPDQDLRRHYSAASGRERHRLVYRSRQDGYRNRRCRDRAQAFPALGSTLSLAPDCQPACPSPGFKPISSPGRFCTPSHGQISAILFCC